MSVDSTRYDSVFRPNLFDDQVALITGGGTGIGRAIAHELASLGATVVIGARRRAPLESTAQEIVAAGGKANSAPVDIRQQDQIEDLVATVISDHRRIDLLVNNAGGQFPHRLNKSVPTGGEPSSIQI